LRLIVLWLGRLAVLLLGVFAVWFILFVFRVTDHRRSWIVALAITYALAAYVIIPRVIRMSLKILGRRSAPSFTLTGDGFPGDPVSLVLIGNFQKPRTAFAKAGWVEADPLNLKSSWRMAAALADAVFDELTLGGSEGRQIWAPEA
jgi:hypothetical protein